MKKETCEREYEFALIISGEHELNEQVESTLFEAGCDDATFSIQHGMLYAEFSRSAKSLKDAIVSAILDIRKADIGADALRVDECNLVTAAEIARRINRSRQQVHQYMTGERGPGGFPPPECQLCEGRPLWAWCAASYWLYQNNIISPEDYGNAQTVAAINTQLEVARLRQQSPQLAREIAKELGTSA